MGTSSREGIKPDLKLPAIRPWDSVSDSAVVLISAATRETIKSFSLALKQYGMFVADNGSDWLHDRRTRQALEQFRT